MARRVLLLILLSVAVAALGRSTATAQTQGKRAAIVVRFTDGQNITKCVQFAEDELTGEELLERTELRVVIDASYGEGGAVCAINNTGCPVNDCFCQCRNPNGSDCVFWSYWHWQDDAWQFSPVGAGSYTVADGALEGWSWGRGSGQSGVPPPAFTFDQICNRATSSTPIPIGSQPTPSNAPPEGTFESSALTLQAGSCAVLSWVVYDAARITLNGSPMIAQDRQEVCPTSTQTYTLAAANSVGQFTRNLTITVQGGESAPETVASQPPTSPPTIAPVQQPPANPTAVAPEAQPVLATALPTTPEPPIAVESSFDGMETPVATPAAILPRATEPLSPLALALTALPTPVGTAARGSASNASRSTPTPILLARADVAPAPAVEQRRPQAADFDRALLPGYAAFLFIAAMLLGAAIWVWQRRRTF